MKCPACKQGELIPSCLDNLFPARHCNHCAGDWVLLSDYLNWRDANPDQPFNSAAEVASSDDIRHALICPVTGTLMLKYRISHTSSHRQYPSYLKMRCSARREALRFKAWNRRTSCSSSRFHNAEDGGLSSRPTGAHGFSQCRVAALGKGAPLPACCALP